MIRHGHRWSLPVFLATACGIGRMPRAPGTWASVAAGMVALALLPALPVDQVRLAFIAMTLVASAVGFAVCPAAVRHFGAEDPSAVVIDEVAGVWLALSVMPPTVLHDQPVVAVAVAVLAFRVFDIAKPWPVDWLERRSGPAAIMYDDLAAGLLAGLVATAIMA